MNELIFQTEPIVTIATNTFINVPIILKFEDTNFIEIIKEVKLGYTTKISIYNNDGTYLAKVKGTRMYLTDDGNKAGLKIEKLQNVWVCKMDKQIFFEIHHQTGNSFKTNAELYTPEGYLIKCLDSHLPELIDNLGNALKIDGAILSGNTISGFKTGIWLKKDGSCSIGVNR